MKVHVIGFLGESKPGILDNDFYLFPDQSSQKHGMVLNAVRVDAMPASYGKMVSLLGDPVCVLGRVGDIVPAMSNRGVCRSIGVEKIFLFKP